MQKFTQMEIAKKSNEICQILGKLEKDFEYLDFAFDPQDKAIVISYPDCDEYNYKIGLLRREELMQSLPVEHPKLEGEFFWNMLLKQKGKETGNV